MKLRYLGCAVAGLVLALMAAPVAAQTGELGPPARERGYVIGFGGPAATAVTSPFFGASAGANVTRNIQLVGEVGRMQDVFATFTRDDLRLAEQDFATTEGAVLAASVKMPTVFATGGVRVLLANNYRVRPYLSAGAGVARLDPKPTFLIEGIDLTSIAMQEPALNTMFDRQIKPMAVVGGGVAVEVVRHFTVHAGYRYSRIFVDTNYLQSPDSPHNHKGFNVHRAYLGAGVAF